MNVKYVKYVIISPIILFIILITINYNKIMNETQTEKEKRTEMLNHFRLENTINP